MPCRCTEPVLCLPCSEYKPVRFFQSSFGFLAGRHFLLRTEVFTCLHEFVCPGDVSLHRAIEIIEMLAIMMINR